MKMNRGGIELPDAIRCAWAGAENTRMCRYHDEEWGKPSRDDGTLFEFLLLESFQAGLSWSCILNKREAFRAAFDGFDPEKVVLYGEEKVRALLQDAGIVRAERKIRAAIGNAKAFLEIAREYGSFSNYLWGFTQGKQVCSASGVAITHSPLSDAVSADLKKRGMKFVGTVIVYSYLQAVGVVNDHEPSCFRFAQCRE